MTPNRDDFFARARTLFGGRYSQSQIDGLTAILDEWGNRMPNGDIRWLAYMLATAFHETARTMQPVKEAYWLGESWREKNLRYFPYYGRGYVQLTWRDNYRRASGYVGADLTAKPDQALRADIAAAVMFVGMIEGWFRGDSRGRHTLSRYFNDRVDEPVGAREIINGREIKTVGGQKVLLASVIASYHKAFLNALSPARASVFVAARAAGLPAQAAEMVRDAPHAELEAAGADFDNYTNMRQRGVNINSIEDYDVPPLDAEADYDYDKELDVGTVNTNEREYQDLVRFTVELVSAYVSRNNLEPDQVPKFIAGVHAALQGLTEEASGRNIAEEELDDPGESDVCIENASLSQSDSSADPITTEESAGKNRASAREKLNK